MSTNHKLEAIHRLDTTSGKVLAVDIDPAANTIAAGARDGIVYLVDVESGTVTQRLKGHIDFVFCLAFHPTEETLISSGKDTSLRLWNINTGEFLADLAGIYSGTTSKTLRGQLFKPSRKGHTKTTLSLDWSDTGALTTGGQDHLVKLWKNNEAIRSFDWHAGPVTAVRFRPGTDEVFSASRDRSIRSWNPETGAMLDKYVGHNDEIECLAFTGPNHFVTGDLQGTVLLWEVGRDKPLRTLANHNAAARCAAPVPNQHMVFVAYESGHIALYDADPKSRKKNHCILTKEAHDFAVRSIAFAPKDNLLVSGCNEGFLATWRLT